MKKQLIVSFLVLMSFLINAQIKNRNQFFKTYEDFKDNKPVENISINKWKATSVEYVENGAEKKEKISKLSYAWFCNEQGVLMRVFEENLYYVLTEGSMTLYVKAKDGSIMKQEGSDYYIVGPNIEGFFPAEHYSISPNGPIEKLKDKVLDEQLERYNLTAQYENDREYKRERSDTVIGWASKKLNKKVKYIRMTNSKA